MGSLEETRAPHDEPAAPGLALLADAVGPERNPAAQVAMQNSTPTQNVIMTTRGQ